MGSNLGVRHEKCAIVLLVLFRLLKGAPRVRWSRILIFSAHHYEGGLELQYRTQNELV